jgi:chemotaxis protein MotA
MFVGIGLFIVFVCVFGGFIMAGGKFEILAQAAPHEMLVIIGAAVGSTVIANSSTTLKRVGKGFILAAKGERWSAQDYKDLLCLLYIIVKTIRTKGVVAIESHIENPADSRIFQQFPKIATDHHAVDFICDYIRMMTMNFEDPYQVADAMDQDLEKLHLEEHAAQHSIQTVADGLPAMGIVAAVLGIIKTMGAIDQPPNILGAMIGGALVGTFLGVLLAYCVVGPIASRLGQVIEDEGKFLRLIKTVLIAHLQGLPPQVAVEIGRRNTPSNHAPSFNDMEMALNNLPTDLA